MLPIELNIYAQIIIYIERIIYIINRSAAAIKYMYICKINAYRLY